MRTSLHNLKPKDIRIRFGLNQTEFWARIGVTQSGGSRYERFRNMPRPVQELLRLVYVEQVDLSRIRKADLDILQKLKAGYPQLYKALRKGFPGSRDRQVDIS